VAFAWCAGLFLVARVGAVVLFRRRTR